MSLPTKCDKLVQCCLSGIVFLILRPKGLGNKFHKGWEEQEDGADCDLAVCPGPACLICYHETFVTRLQDLTTLMIGRMCQKLANSVSNSQLLDFDSDSQSFLCEAKLYNHHLWYAPPPLTTFQQSMRSAQQHKKLSSSHPIRKLLSEHQSWHRWTCRCHG